jgi:hypothetical protein
VEEFKINKDSKMVLEEEFRWGDNAGEFCYHHYDLGLVYNLKDYLAVGAGYRHALELKNGSFKTENEPYMLAMLFVELAGFKLDSRNRLEYRHFDYQADSWRYRNKITAKLPWQLTKFKIQPFLTDEISARLTNSTRTGFFPVFC